MTAWRMSFRVGNQGHEMWPQCLRLGVAAITYDPLIETDLSKYPEGEPEELWNELEPTQKASLRRVAYEMKAGDVIYVKKGPKIVDKGVVKGPAKRNAYLFDSEFRLRQPDGTPWAHQVPVDWSANFPELDILLGGEQVTVKELASGEVTQIETAIGAVRAKTRGTSPGVETASKSLIEDAYYRESPARLKIIIPRHNKLSNEFVKWLKKEYGTTAKQERDRIDIHFSLNAKSCLAELKVCFGVGARKSIREALGQLLEYNHYPKRQSADTWLVVLDEEPALDDFDFVHTLREKRALPIVIGWCSGNGFRFRPTWP
jgi:hypothetical protein